jgi:flagellar basal-body rod protein FlgB
MPEPFGTPLARPLVSPLFGALLHNARRETTNSSTPEIPRQRRRSTMNEISDNAIMAALGRQMTQAVARQAVAAGNLANVDTPGYRAREATFGDILNGEVQKLEMARTDTRQLRGAGADGPQAREVEGLESRRDGNNVQLDRELLTMTRASADFAAAQTALSAKFRLIRFAINEGR